MKTCPRCNISKPLEEFRNSSKTEDKKDNICTKCRQHAYATKYYLSNKNYYQQNREKIINYTKKWITNNKTRHKETVKRNRDKTYRGIIRTVRELIFKGSFYYSPVLGCCPAQCCEIIESLFEPDMNWDTYGKNWRLCFKVPLRSVNLKNEEERRILTHYSNIIIKRINLTSTPRPFIPET